MIPDVIHNLPDPELHCNATWPGVHPTPGFTTITTVPGCGLHREARASPHPPRARATVQVTLAATTSGAKEAPDRPLDNVLCQSVITLPVHFNFSGAHHPDTSCQVALVSVSVLGLACSTTGHRRPAG